MQTCIVRVVQPTIVSVEQNYTNLSRLDEIPGSSGLKFPLGQF